MKRRNRAPENLEAPRESLGKRLACLRIEKGIEIERAAHETRIRAACLREIESDDFTRLPSAYARMILRNYARYLGLAEDEIAGDLPEAVGFGVEGYEYIRNAPGNEGVPVPQSGGRRVAVRPRRSRRALLLAPLAVLALTFVGFQVWMTVRKLERIQESTPAAAPLAATSRVSPEQEVATFRAVGESDSEFLLAPGNAMVGENPVSDPAARALSDNL